MVGFFESGGDLFWFGVAEVATCGLSGVTSGDSSTGAVFCGLACFLGVECD